MAPTPSSSTSLAVQAMAMRAAQRLTGLLSVSLFLQTAFVCDPRRRVVLIFVCVGVVTACCSVMGLGDDRSSASICSCTAVIVIFFCFVYFHSKKGNIGANSYLLPCVTFGPKGFGPSAMRADHARATTSLRAAHRTVFLVLDHRRNPHDAQAACRRPRPKLPAPAT